MITRVKGSTFRSIDNFNYVSLTDLGAAGTDITTALQAALTAGTPVYIPIGSWLFSSLTIPDDAIIFGCGRKSILKQKDLSNSVAINIASSRVLLQDFFLDGNKANQVGSSLHGILLNGAIDAQIIQVYVQNTKGSGFRITGAATNEVHLIDCYSKGHTESGILVDTGSNISLINPRIMDSDLLATGDGISIVSNGGAVSNVLIETPVVRNQAVRGIALAGNGSRNVTSVSINNPRVSNSVNSGIFLTNADGCTVSGGMSNSNSIDGLRVEGDVQNCRFFGVNCRTNVSFGTREVTVGSTPNFNGFIYGITSGNGNNAITKVGASSYVV